MVEFENGKAKAKAKTEITIINWLSGLNSPDIVVLSHRSAKPICLVTSYTLTMHELRTDLACERRRPTEVRM